MVRIKTGGVMQTQPLFSTAQLPVALTGNRIQVKHRIMAIDYQRCAILGQLFIPIKKLIGVAVAFAVLFGGYSVDHYGCY